MKIALALVSVVAAGCSVRQYAINQLGSALAGSGTTFASDDDPELIREALPFSLKLIESVLAESPQHRGLLVAAARGFTSYAYAFIQEDADQVEDREVAAATALRRRARALYLRGRDYGLRGLSAKRPDFATSLRGNPRAAAATVAKKDVDLLYWTASAWGLAISLSKDEPDLIAEQPQVEALIDRALLLDPSFESGAIHGFLISYEWSRPGAKGNPADRSRAHFERAVELSKGELASPFVTFAEATSVMKQDRKEFQMLLDRALAVDVRARAEWRLQNRVSQHRARWLLSRIDELFLEQEDR